jgi:hypothetical protein
MAGVDQAPQGVQRMKSPPGHELEVRRLIGFEDEE